jgi:hypothetical protein
MCGATPPLPQYAFMGWWSGTILPSPFTFSYSISEISRFASREISRLLQNPKFHCRVHCIPTLYPILNQLSQFQIFKSCFIDKKFNIILASTLRSCKWSLSFSFFKLRCTITSNTSYTRAYPKDSGLVAWSENCIWYSSLPLGAVVSLFCESVSWVLPP